MIAGWENPYFGIYPIFFNSETPLKLIYCGNNALIAVNRCMWQEWQNSKPQLVNLNLN